MAGQDEMRLVERTRSAVAWAERIGRNLSPASEIKDRVRILEGDSLCTAVSLDPQKRAQIPSRSNKYGANGRHNVDSTSRIVVSQVRRVVWAVVAAPFGKFRFKPFPWSGHSQIAFTGHTAMKAMLATAWKRSLMRTMLHMPKPWVAWLAVLILVNLVGGLYYFGSLEGKLVVAAFFGAIIVMEAIFKAKGFVRLLGLGHIFWVPLVPWLALRLDWGPPGQRLRAVGGGGGGAEHPLAGPRRHRRGALRQGRAGPDDHPARMIVLIGATGTVGRHVAYAAMGGPDLWSRDPRRPDEPSF